MNDLQDYGVVRTMAIGFNKTTGLPVDEFLSMGNLVYAECLKRFDEGRGVPFRGFLVQALRNRYSSAIKADYFRMIPRAIEDLSEDRNPQTCIQSTNWQNYKPSVQDIAENYELRDSVNSLSSEAKEVLDIVFNSPEELKTMTQNGIRTYLRDKGWKFDNITSIFNEIKNVL